jgi:hypothetical protein
LSHASGHSSSNSSRRNRKMQRAQSRPGRGSADHRFAEALERLDGMIE